MIEARRILLMPDGWIPNNPRRPVLVYRNVVDPDHHDIGGALARLFVRHGWDVEGRGNIQGGYHYHSQAHEVIGIASGSAILGLGGPRSVRIAVDATDVLVLPAGTGHCRLRDSADFAVVTGWPAGQRPDVRREAPSADVARCIAQLPYPQADPVLGTR